MVGRVVAMSSEDVNDEELLALLDKAEQGEVPETPLRTTKG